MRWIVFGTGNVARKFTLDLAHAGHQVVAVASRDPANAKRFADDLGLNAQAGDYEVALQTPAEAVYIATPPRLHEPHALMAIAAGRAVLVEKPFAQDAEAGLRITAAARAAGIFAMEAMWTRFQPLVGAVRARIQAGDLGEVRGFDARFLAANIPDAAVGLFDPGQGGGALLHRGIYPLSLARHFFGPVAQLRAETWTGETGVDEETALLIRHESGVLSVIRASLRAQGREDSTIWGTGGTAHLRGPVYRPDAAYVQPTRPAAVAQGGAARRFEAFRESAWGLRLSGALSGLRQRQARQPIRATRTGNGYHYQAVAVAEALATGQLEDARMPLDESVEILQLMGRLRDGKG